MPPVDRRNPIRRACSESTCSLMEFMREFGKKGYTHRRIKHSARVYVQGDVHTQTIDGFFGLFKTGVRGAHHAVSHKWLQGYLNEWTWRYNRRDNERSMFHDLVGEAVSRTN